MSIEISDQFSIEKKALVFTNISKLDYLLY